MKPKTVLIVDDDEAMIGIIRYLLNSGGMEAIAAKNLEEAELALMNVRIDCALVDMVLFKQSGISVLKKIKELQPEVPVLMMTGWGYVSGFMLDAFRNGASAYLDKGRIVEISELIDKVINKNEK